MTCSSGNMIYFHKLISEDYNKEVYMKYVTLISIFSLLFTFQFLPAGDLQDDPLSESYIIREGGGNELIGIKQAYVSYPTYAISVEVSKYFKAMQVTPTDTILRVLEYREEFDSYDVQYDLVTLNANGDELSEIVAAWIVNNKIEIVVLQAEPTFLGIDTLASWSKVTRLSKSDPTWFEGDWWLLSPPLLAVGEFDGDESDEFALAYWTIDTQQKTWVNLTLYDVNDSLEVTELASLKDQPLVMPPKFEGGEASLNIFDLTAGDYNGDGRDEILLAGRESRDPQGWNIFANIYSYDSGSSQLVRNLHEIIYTMPDTLNDIADIDALSGHLNNKNYQQAVVSFYQYGPYYSSKPDTVYAYMLAISFDELLSQITISQLFNRVKAEATTTTPNIPHTSLSGDINGDGLEEIISKINPPSFRIYQLNQQLQFTEYANLDDLYPGPYTNFNIGEIIIDSLGAPAIPELILTSYPSTQIYKLNIDVNGAFKGATLVASGEDTYGGESTPMLTADLDGDIRLGAPKRSSITKILQPLVILNSPPIHFDVLEGDTYDVCLSYNENNGQFISSYEKESSQSTEVQTEINKDWGISSTLSTSHSFFGVSVKSHLTAKYGEKFSKQSGSSSKVTVGISVDAREDDRIYATVLDYNVWEYPVYGNGVKKGDVLVVEPVMTENRWFPSKSWSGYSYVPNHEVGNILSYREYPVLSDNPEVDEKIKGDYNNSFVLDANSSYDWTLQFEDFQSAGVTTQKEFGMDWGASIGGWGVNLSVEGHYSREEIHTQRTEVSSGLLMNVHLDAVDMSLGEVPYRVTPYSYWAKNGALVMDYAVIPELAQPGGTPTWWQVHYNDLADPAFILPWRYDPEKGFTLQEEAKRHQTKDIIFFPADPKEGDLVTITARLHNFSLIPTPVPMGVSFYIGDPDDGGTLIVGEGNVTKVYTSTAIPARGTRTVEMQWTIPNDIGTFPRIYALIDPDYSLTEIHENNNKGWTILGKSTVTNIVDKANLNKPTAFVLKQNYPNPFNPSTIIKFDIPLPSLVQLKVYNILGEEVATLVSDRITAGSYTYEWSRPAGIASGVYLYRLEAGDYVETKKMILMK